jgi:glycosyltransferase involved in cell wall biosynthesis
MIPVSVIIPTLNEGPNIERCLRAIEGLCDQIFVMDSGSKDETIPIAKRFVEDVHHVPYSHLGIGPYFFQWALDTLPVRNEWVLFLEADRAVSPELRQELEELFARPHIAENGFYIRRVQVFRGREIRHGGYGNKRFLILFRRAHGRLDPDEKDTRVYVDGPIGHLAHPVIEDNVKENDILFYLSKHIRYAEAFAEEEFKRRHQGPQWKLEPSLFGTPDQRTLALKDVYLKTPPYARSLLYFSYRYFLRLGILDGKEGALFHFLQGFWFRLVVDIRLEELEKKAREAKEP